MFFVTLLSVSLAQDHLLGIQKATDHPETTVLRGDAPRTGTGHSGYLTCAEPRLAKSTTQLRNGGENIDAQLNRLFPDRDRRRPLNNSGSSGERKNLQSPATRDSTAEATFGETQLRSS